MKNTLLLFAFLCYSLLVPIVNAQCNLTVTTSDSTVVCGESLEISAAGLSGLSPVLTADFNSGTLGLGWTTAPNFNFTSPCGPSLDGTPSAWFGYDTLPRVLISDSFNLSCGAQVCFDFDFAGDDGGINCEDPDSFNEGVFFSYSIDGGTTWVVIYYFEPNITNTGPYYQWANYCFTLPQEAWTASTKFKWEQPTPTAQAFDHWGIDNVVITPSDCNFWYDWAHIPGIPDSSAQTITPSDTTTYYVSYTNGVTVCTDSIVVNVLPLEIDILANPNPIDCGSCSNLSVQFVNGTDQSIGDDFNSGIDASVWGDIQSGTVSVICGGSLSGNALYFDGAGTSRYAETVAIDASSCMTIDFCLYMGNTGSGGAPCENNETGEDIVLEYSTDGGSTFVPIATYIESLWDGNNFQQCFSETIPTPAVSASTIFRWRQVAFGAFVGSDNWSLDEVIISCSNVPSTTAYNWTTGLVDNPASSTPIACPTSSELYTVSVTDLSSGCVATDTTTLFVNECSCFFSQFDGTAVSQPGGTVEVNGTFEYDFSPTTGTIEVEATNGTGTYSQTFNAPFTNNVSNNYSIPGIPNDGSTITMDVYFSDSLTCNQTFDLTAPTACSFVQFDGVISPQINGDLDISGTFEFAFSPSTGTLEVDVTNGTGTYSQTFNSPFSNGLLYNYLITGIPNDGSVITVIMYFSDSLNCSETFQLSPNVGIELIESQEGTCIVSPNPVNDEAELNFNNESQEEVTISIVNERGQLVFETTTTEESVSIKGNQFKQGMYFFTLKSSGVEVCSGKFAVTY